MGSFTRLEKIVILIIALLITSIFGYKIFLNNDGNDIQIEENGLFLDEEKGNKEQDENELFADDNNEDNAPTQVVVHITGAVSKPGVVVLKNGDRVIDAIKKAGGLLSSADENNINLAQKLFDEDKVTIPSHGDNLQLDNSGQETSNAPNDNNQSMVSSGSGGVESSSASSDSSGSGGGSININTASKSELETLPGIGDKTSQKIIDYRDSTKFSSVEDIKNVSGIGEKKFEAIQSMITTK